MAPLATKASPLGDRPSSSDGPSTATKRTDFDKRKSRDDLYLMTMTTEKQNFRSFHVPNRSRFFSVDSGGGGGGPNQQRQQEHLTAPSRQPPSQMLAASSLTKRQGEGVIAIGMALGSPAHPPAGAWSPEQSQSPHQSQPPLQTHVAATTPLAQTSSPNTPGTPEEPAAKPKARKWSIFSRSKSKKGKNPVTSEASSPQPQLPPQQQRQHQPPPVSLNSQRKQGDASHSPRRGSAAEGPRPQDNSQGVANTRAEPSSANRPKHKPIVVPYEPPVPTLTRAVTDLGPSPLSHHPTHRFNQHDPRNPNPRMAPGYGGNPKMMPGGPLLNVEIPDITMERYSVMFGQVLKQPPVKDRREQTPQAARDAPPPPSSDSPTSSSSSLLARRQATLGRLKNINDEEPLGPLEPPRMRRASSSQAKQSPSLTLFPPPSLDRIGVARPHSPRARSSTSPAIIPMPTRPPPEPPIPRLESSRAQTFPTIGNKGGLNDNTMSSSPQVRPRLASKFQRRPSETEVKRVDSVVDSPTSMEDSSPQLTRKESASDVMTPPTSTTTSRTSTPKKDSVSSIASEHISVVKPPQPEETDEDRTLREAVQASITRQISVSREQREMLKPFRAQSRRKGRPLGPGQIAIGENERLAETKKSTPTLVHPDTDMLSPKAVHPHRRSEQVVFDAA